MTELIDIIIGTCPECGHPVRTTEGRRTRRDGLLEHITCPPDNNPPPTTNH